MWVNSGCIANSAQHSQLHRSYNQDLISADRSNKATLLLSSAYNTPLLEKSSAKDLGAKS